MRRRTDSRSSLASSFRRARTTLSAVNRLGGSTDEGAFRQDEAIFQSVALLLFEYRVVIYSAFRCYACPSAVMGTCGLWLVACGLWLVACGLWLVACSV